MGRNTTEMKKMGYTSEGAYFSKTEDGCLHELRPAPAKSRKVEWEGTVTAEDGEGAVLAEVRAPCHLTCARELAAVIAEVLS